MSRPQESVLLVLLWSLLMAVTGAGSPSADGQSDPAVDERFSMYQSALNSAADTALKNFSYRSPMRLRRQPESESHSGDLASGELPFREFALRYWGGRREDLRRALNRLGRLRPQIEPILRSEGVPPDLIAVVLIESAGLPAAQSSREARGLWQFIPATARRYGLSVDGQSDERVVTEKATHAAARHLRDLYVRFGSWPLALAAYDAGERAVQGAIELGGTTDFWELRSKRLLPKETRDYVPAVLAAVKLLGYPSALSRPAEAKEQNAESQAVRVVYALTAGGD